MTAPAWISLGSNLGDRQAILDEAVNRLAQTPGVVVSAISSSYETQPVGGPAGQAPFLNAAARLDTTLSPHNLLAVLQAIERALGRVRTVRWGERTLDLDILIYGCKFIDEPDLKIPHPRLALRRFVLEPLAEIAPHIGDSITRRRIGDLLANLNRLPRLIMLDDRLDQSFPRLYQNLAAALNGCSIPFQTSDTQHCSLSDGDQTRPLARSNLHKIRRLRAITESCPPQRDCWTVFNFAVDASRYRSTELSESTLIVAMDSLSPARKPGVCSTPIYWPEATEPDAIVAEVVAVCRGIEGV